MTAETSFNYSFFTFTDIVNEKHKQSTEQFRLLTPEGQIRWYEIYSMGIHGEDGKIDRLIGTREDITEEIEREQRLRNYIQRSELAIQVANIIQWDLDIKTQEYTRLYPDPVAPGNFIRGSFNFTVHPDDRLILQQEQDKRIRECKGYSNLHLRIMLDGDMDYRWTNTFSVPLEYYPDGSIKSVTGILIDITHIEKVEEGNRMKMAFLANMSHEIRTPLNAIVGFSQLLAQTDEHEDKEEFVRIIEENNDLLLQIINDILDISKIDAGKMTFNYSDFDITEIITDLKQVYNSHLSPKVKFICNLPYKKKRLQKPHHGTFATSSSFPLFTAQQNSIERLWLDRHCYSTIPHFYNGLPPGRLRVMDNQYIAAIRITKCHHIGKLSRNR